MGQFESVHTASADPTSIAVSMLAWGYAAEHLSQLQIWALL